MPGSPPPGHADQGGGAAGLMWGRLLREGRRTGAVQLLVGLWLLIPPLLVASLAHRHGYGPFTDARWNVDMDRSYIEWLGYLQLLVAAGLLLSVARLTATVYAAWAGALAVVALDDALEWHERGGKWLDRNWTIPEPPGLRTQDVGELITWAILGACVTIILVLAHRRSTRAARRDSLRLAGLIAVLMVFAVGVDMAHEVLQTISSSSRLDLLAVWLEAAGEVGAMAAVLAYTVHVARRDP